MLARGLLGLPRYPLRLLRALPSALPNLDETAFSTLPGHGRRRTRGRRRVGQRAQPGRRAACSSARASRRRAPASTAASRRTGASSFGRLSLEAVKRVKNRHGCTVNDVVVSICAGAVRRWLEEHGELPDEPLVAQIPVSVRSSEQAGTFGNRIMLMSAPLFTNVEDPVERLLQTHEALRVDEGAPPRAARGAAPGREPLHPAGGVLARGACDLRALQRSRRGRPGTS